MNSHIRPGLDSWTEHRAALLSERVVDKRPNSLSIVLTFQVNPSVLGGLTVDFGDKSSESHGIIACMTGEETNAFSRPLRRVQGRPLQHCPQPGCLDGRPGEWESGRVEDKKGNVECKAK